MTAAEQTSELGKRTVDGFGYLFIDGLSIRVQVIDTRQAFGRMDALVTPNSGSGVKWVSMDRISKTDH